MNTDTLQDIINKVADKSHELMKNYPDRRGYNLFNILGVDDKEVVMCRFLADLLNPQGEHACGYLFLESFCQDVLKITGQSATILERTTVTTEYVINNERRIDIVIQNDNHFIPIEAKLFAGDQPRQCFDYYEYAKQYDDSARVVYLTIDGKEPSASSRAGLNRTDIYCISWTRDIIMWLDSLLSKCTDPVVDGLRQYKEAIESITKNNLSIRNAEMTKFIKSIVTNSKDSFKACIEIEKSINELKLELIQQIFQEFQSQMDDLCIKYGLELEKKAKYYSYDGQAGKDFYVNNSSSWPGLNYVVKNAKFSDPAKQMWFRVEIDNNLFAGFIMYDISATTETKPGYSECGNKISPIPSEVYTEAEGLLKHRNAETNCNWWLSCYYPNGKSAVKSHNYSDVPNFKTMNECAISLMDENTRKTFVKNALNVFEETLLKQLN